MQKFFYTSIKTSYQSRKQTHFAIRESIQYPIVACHGCCFTLKIMLMLPDPTRTINWIRPVLEPRAFAYVASNLWSRLPVEIRFITPSGCSKLRLRTSSSSFPISFNYYLCSKPFKTLGSIDFFYCRCKERKTLLTISLLFCR